MPVAVPTGEYLLTATVDLSPLFGVITDEARVSVRVPDEDVLERRLAALGSEDVNVRRAALVDLRYFPDEGEKVVPALLDLLDDEEDVIRTIALSVLAAYPEQSAAHADTFLAILADEEGKTVSERANAAYVLSRTAPASEDVESALTAAADSDDPVTKARFATYLRIYRNRVKDG